MSLEFPSQKKSRNERLLGHTKAYATEIVKRIPSNLEGAEGDIAVGVTSKGIKLFAKIGNQWYSFSPDSIDVSESSKIVNFTPTEAGTVATPSKSLHPSDSGKTYFIDISTYRVLFKLPAVASSSGVNYTFIMAEESAGVSHDDKDFILITNSTSEDLMGTFHAGGTTINVGAARSIIQFNSNTNAVQAGDWLELVCNGKEWYLNGISFADNFDAADDFTIV